VRWRCEDDEDEDEDQNVLCFGTALHLFKHSQIIIIILIILIIQRRRGCFEMRMRRMAFRGLSLGPAALGPKAAQPPI
jgi:hypothetical protein